VRDYRTEPKLCDSAHHSIRVCTFFNRGDEPATLHLCGLHWAHPFSHRCAECGLSWPKVRKSEDAV
jgi:hypothetical protein